MPDIASIATFLGSIKTATEIAKAIKISDSSLEKAELKLKIAELMESLADVKIQAVEIQELVREKDKDIRNLKRLLEGKENTQVEKLSEECVKILESLNNIPEEADGLTSPQIAHYSQIPEPKTRYLLDLLKEKDFIIYMIDMDIGAQYNISKNGRKYLFENT